jgi:hypothetical protein
MPGQAGAGLAARRLDVADQDHAGGVDERAQAERAAVGGDLPVELRVPQVEPAVEQLDSADGVEGEVSDGQPAALMPGPAALAMVVGIAAADVDAHRVGPGAVEHGAHRPVAEEGGGEPVGGRAFPDQVVPGEEAREVHGLGAGGAGDGEQQGGQVA